MTAPAQRRDGRLRAARRCGWSNLNPFGGLLTRPRGAPQLARYVDFGDSRHHPLEEGGPTSGSNRGDRSSASFGRIRLLWRSRRPISLPVARHENIACRRDLLYAAWALSRTERESDLAAAIRRLMVSAASRSVPAASALHAGGPRAAAGARSARAASPASWASTRSGIPSHGLRRGVPATTLR